MTDFLNIFGVYDFAVRDALALILVALATYVLLSAGIFAVPQVGLMAVGAYVSVYVSLDLGYPFPVSLAGGAIAATAVGIVLAGLLARLSGIYLAIASIAFNAVVAVAVLNIPGSGGAQGRVGIPLAANDAYLTATLGVSILALIAAKRSRIGLAMAAMRENQLMAKHQGINVFAFRCGLFAASGLLSGLGGALSVHKSGFIQPGQFSFALLTQILATVVIGGMTYVSGSMVGALIVFGLPQTLRGFAEYQNIANGVAIIIIISFAPVGLIGLVDSLRHRRKGLLVESSLPDDTGSEDLSSVAAQASLPRASTPRVHERGAVSAQFASISKFFGGVQALKTVSAQVHEREILGIIGPNGSGKTTLLNVMSGVYPPTGGEGRLLGLPMRALWGKPHRISAVGLARTFQTIRLIDDKSVADNIRVGLARGNRSVPTILREHGLESVSDTLAGELPYGVRRRVEIARAAARQPRVLLLDEPTAGMNSAERLEVFETVVQLRDAGMAVVIVEHDVEMMAAFCDRLIVLNFGEVIADGRSADVLANAEVIGAYVGSGA